MYVFLKTNFRTNPHDVRFTAEMSALGQKQTFRDVEAMSALLPIADIRTSSSFAVLNSARPILDLFQPGFAHAFEEFRHRARGIWDVAFDPRDRMFRLQFH